MIEDTVLG